MNNNHFLYRFQNRCQKFSGWVALNLLTIWQARKEVTCQLVKTTCPRQQDSCFLKSGMSLIEADNMHNSSSIFQIVNIIPFFFS